AAKLQAIRFVVNPSRYIRKPSFVLSVDPGTRKLLSGGYGYPSCPGKDDLVGRVTRNPPFASSAGQ
ncbi:hypothetical protein JG688_00014026, partial [Phytophthora aleatoria]